MKNILTSIFTDKNGNLSSKRIVGTFVVLVALVFSAIYVYTLLFTKIDLLRIKQMKPLIEWILLGGLGLISSSLIEKKDIKV